MLADGTYVETVPDSVDDIMAGITAAAESSLVNPPREWFSNPGLTRKTPMTVTADGRIFGHIAPWDAEHTGMPGVRPPRSATNYAFFKTGIIACADGSEVPVGQITLAGGHCNDLRASPGAAVAHYDDTASAVADVNVGEDMYGIWAAGALRPGVTPEQTRTLRASVPSGDWRYINGNRELIAICQVNAPGFPVARAMVAGGEMLALVAAGAAEMYSLRQQEAVLAAINNVEDRMTRLEDRLMHVESPKPATTGPKFNLESGSLTFNIDTSNGTAT